MIFDKMFKKRPRIILLEAFIFFFLMFGSAFADYTIHDYTGTTSYGDQIGYTGARAYAGFDFITVGAGVVTLEQVCLYTTGGTLTSTYRFGIMADSSGVPSGTYLDYYDWTFNGTFTEQLKTLPTAPSITATASTKYWAVIQRLTGSGEPGLAVCGDASSTEYYYSADGSTWTGPSAATALNFIVEVVEGSEIPIVSTTNFITATSTVMELRLTNLLLIMFGFAGVIGGAIMTYRV